jgi:hypothetical protein
MYSFCSPDGILAMARRNVRCGRGGLKNHQVNQTKIQDDTSAARYRLRQPNRKKENLRGDDEHYRVCDYRSNSRCEEREIISPPEVSPGLATKSDQGIHYVRAGNCNNPSHDIARNKADGFGAAEMERTCHPSKGNYEWRKLEAPAGRKEHAIIDQRVDHPESAIQGDLFEYLAVLAGL